MHYRMKKLAASKVLTTVNASYHGSVNARQLADRISDPRSAVLVDAFVLAFFSEVRLDHQRDFIDEMNLDMAVVIQVARLFAEKAGMPLALAD